MQLVLWLCRSAPPVGSRVRVYEHEGEGTVVEVRPGMRPEGTPLALVALDANRESLWFFVNRVRPV